MFSRKVLKAHCLHPLPNMFLFFCILVEGKRSGNKQMGEETEASSPFMFRYFV